MERQEFLHSEQLNCVQNVIYDCPFKESEYRYHIRRHPVNIEKRNQLKVASGEKSQSAAF
jgi:hypothetical protein